MSQWTIKISTDRQYVEYYIHVHYTFSLNLVLVFVQRVYYFIFYFFCLLYFIRFNVGLFVCYLFYFFFLFQLFWVRVPLVFAFVKMTTTYTSYTSYQTKIKWYNEWFSHIQIHKHILTLTYVHGAGVCYGILTESQSKHNLNSKAKSKTNKKKPWNFAMKEVNSLESVLNST